MPLKSDTVEAAARTLLLLEELNRHRVASIDILHRATRLPKSTVVRLMKSLCAMGYAVNDPRQGDHMILVGVHAPWRYEAQQMTHTAAGLQVGDEFLQRWIGGDTSVGHGGFNTR